MIIGKINVDTKSLLINAKTPEMFKQFCKNLVPADFQHVEAIVQNQMYYCCLLYRQQDSVKWETKENLINAVLQDVRVVGFTNEVTEIQQVYAYIDRDRLNKYLGGAK